MGLLFLYFSLAIVFSFLCSIWEAVLLSISDSFVELKAREGKRTGILLKRFKDPERIDKPLSAILTLNTLAHTLGAIFVGSQAQQIWGDTPIRIFGIVMPFGAEGLVGGLMTLAILYLSEIIPKTWGAIFWRQLASFTVQSVNVVIIILWPLVKVSLLITKVLKSKHQKSVLSRAEITVMAEKGEAQGVVKAGESRIIRNLMRFHTVRTKDIMTPRTVVMVESETTPIREFHDKHPNLRFSRIPVYRESKDHITGFILKDEMLTAIIHDRGDQPLNSILRPIPMVNEYLPLPELYDRLMEQREHIALVVDEFGGMSGIVTMEDLIETLLGIEIMDELDSVEDMQRWARKKWEERAKALGIIPAVEDEEKID